MPIGTFRLSTAVINKANSVTVSYGQQDKISSGAALAWIYKFSKQTNVYAGYGIIDSDTCTATACSIDLGLKSDGTPLDSNGLLTLGIRKSF